MSEHEQITVIGPDTRIKGEMSFDRTARILGRFEGKVTTAGELQVGASAHCAAALEAGTVIVDGTVDGDILARERVQLNGSARVNGDVVAEKLIVAEGASFSGHCRVGPEAVKQASAPKPPAAHAEPKAEAPRATGPKFDWVGHPVAVEAQAKPAWGPAARSVAEGAA
ncbi:MAG TPA: polymer-forming cytoskeletal protein [Phycisphaerales bacterium]|nr:polymer-forming cytoskeletal protein [Phycisphaerales bacterium]